MLDTLKIYTHKEISLDKALENLLDLNYKRQQEVLEAGDFSIRGDTLEIYPANFNFPIRIEWEFDKVSKIYSFDKGLKRKIIDYDFLIITPYFKRYKRK